MSRLVLLAAAVVLAGCSTGGAGAESAGSDCSDTTPELRLAMADKPVVTAAAAHPRLSSLVSAIRDAGLAKTLDSARNLTLFAPTDAAFARSDTELAAVRADKHRLTGLVSHHFTGVLPQDGSAPSTVQTLQGGTLTVAADPAGVTVNGLIHTTCAGIEVAGGTIYLVDSVLFPPD